MKREVGGRKKMMELILFGLIGTLIEVWVVVLVVGQVVMVWVMMVVVMVVAAT